MLGAIFKAAGSIFQGNSAYAGAKAKSAALKRDALSARQAGESQAMAITRNAREGIAAGTVSAGSSGFTVDGSALDVLSYMAQQYDANARVARRNAELSAVRLRNEAAVTLYEGKVARMTGYINAATSLAEGFEGGGGGGGGNSDKAAKAAKVAGA